MIKKALALTAIILLWFSSLAICVPSEDNQPQASFPDNKLAKEIQSIKKELLGNNTKINKTEKYSASNIEKNTKALKRGFIEIKNDVAEFQKENDKINVWASFFIPLIASIIGAAIAGYCSLKATKNAHKNELKKQENNQKNEIKNLLQAIHDEISILWETYLWGVGNDLEKLENEKPLNVYYPLTQEYFTTYNNMSHLIGTIENDKLRKSIIETYTMCRSLVDSYRLNNDFVQKYEHWYWLFIETNEESHAAKAQSQLIVLTNYAKTLKEIHFKLKKKKQNLIKLIEEEQKKVYRDRTPHH